MSNSVRDRIAVTEGQDRAATTDFTGRKLGTMTVTERGSRGNGFVYRVTCQCGATGQTISQDELSRGVVPRCQRAGCGKTSTAERSQINPNAGYRGAPSSARARAEAAAREKAIAEMEGAQ
jgi:hypothetical protein